MKSINQILIFILTALTSLVLVNCSSDNEDMPKPVELGAPNGIQAFDIGNKINSSDIRVFFTAGSNRDKIREYRVMVVPTTSAGNFNLEQAMLIETGRYFSLTSNLTNPKFNLGEGITDTDGSEVQNDKSYKIFVLAIAANPEIESILSNSSPELTLTAKELKDIYISSNKTNSVELFDGVTGEHIRSFVAAGSGQLGGTQEVIFLEDGNLLVTGIGNSALKLFDGNTGAFIRNFTSGYSLDKPTKTNIGPDGFLYVSQWGETQNAVVRFDLASGEFIDEVIPSFFQGMDQAWDSEGNLYVVSWGLKQLRKYNSNFELLNSTESQLMGPVNIWIDETDVLFVVDWTDGKVKKFDSQDLTYMSTFISGLTNVEGYVFDGDKIYLCDWKDNKVNIYNASTGAFIKTFISSSKLTEPNGISFGPDHRPS